MLDDARRSCIQGARRDIFRLSEITTQSHPQGIVKTAGSPTIARNATEKRAQKRPQKRAQKQNNIKIMTDFPLLIFDHVALHF